MENMYYIFIRLEKTDKPDQLKVKLLGKNIFVDSFKESMQKKQSTQKKIIFHTRHTYHKNDYDFQVFL